MNIAQELERLEQLRIKGALSDVEFQAAKNSLLNGQAKPPTKFADTTVHGLEEKTWCTLMHISQLLNFSGIGIVVPVAMWIVGKEKSEMVNQQGNRMMNWIISSFIYMVAAGLLCFVVVGIPILFGLAVLTVVFPIMAALKANDNKVWTYPLTIKFLPED
jgi:uncharacterized Tic20 family protein